MVPFVFVYKNLCSHTQAWRVCKNIYTCDDQIFDTIGQLDLVRSTWRVWAKHVRIMNVVCHEICSKISLSMHAIVFVYVKCSIHVCYMYVTFIQVECNSFNIHKRAHLYFEMRLI